MTSTIDKTLKYKNHMISRRKLLVASSSAAIAGILNQYNPKKVLAASGQVVHFAPAGKRFDGVARALIPLFNKKYPNIKIKLESLPINETLTKTKVLMRSKSSAFDVITEDHANFAMMHKLGALTPLDKMLESDTKWYNEYKEDVSDSYRALYRWPRPNGTQYGMSNDGNVNLMFYRKDVFDKLGISVPKTWEDVLDVMKEIHDPKNERYAYAAAMKRNFWAGFEFYAALRSFGGHQFDRKEEGYWNPTFNSEAGYQALKVLKDMMQFAHPVTSNAGEDEINAAFANGSALFGPLSWGTATLNNPDFTKLYEDWHFDLPPKGSNPEGGHRPLTGGLGQFIPTWSKNKDAAFEWMKFLNSGDAQDREITDTLVKVGGQPARLSALNRYKNTKYFFAGLLKCFPYAVSHVVAIPEAYNIFDQIGAEVHDAANGYISIDDALKEIDKKTRRILSDSGYYK